MELWRKTVRNLGKILQDIEISALVNGVLSAIGSLIYIYVSGLSSSPVIGVFSLAILLICFYIIVYVAMKIINKIGEGLIRFSEKWYPAWLYRPKFFYYLRQDQKGELTLYIKSSPNNKKARLRLDLYRVKLINARDEQKRQTDSDLGNIRSRTLYDADIDPKDIRTVTISDRSTTGSKMLRLPFDHFGVALFPGKYVYEFHESGNHKATNFGGKPIRLEFEFTENETFEV